MTFEWDENKNEINKTKHGISFETAKTVFYDENAEVSVGKKVLPNTVMMGINTAEFGRTADLMEGLNDKVERLIKEQLHSRGIRI